ncbi:MAG: hypothetical protein ABIO55_11375 [Ginsengibacter sp.]
MKHSDDIYNELQEITPALAQLEKVNVFSVPENYFSGLNEQILTRVRGDLFFILPASEPSSLDVPDGYFENLAETILQKIKSSEAENAGEELRQLSVMLYSVQNENVFTVPERYFDTLPVAILKAVRPSAAKVVVMKKRGMLWTAAAAAMLTGIMAISALWISNNSLQENTVIVYNSKVALNIKDARQYKTDQQINEGITALSDADIVKYLETTGSNADDEAVASGISEKELPDERDYLINDNTLQIFLGKERSQNNQN